VYWVSPTSSWAHPEGGANRWDIVAYRMNTESLGGLSNGLTGGNCFFDSLAAWTSGSAYPSPDDELWIKVVWETEKDNFERYKWNST